MERMESMPSLPDTGTPMTGLLVNDATAPGSAAARPATAMNTSALLCSTISFTRSGVRWAEATIISASTPKRFRTSRALRPTSASLLLPRMMRTEAIGSLTEFK